MGEILMFYKKFVAATALTAAIVSVSTAPAFAEEMINTGKENLVYDANKNLTSEEIYDRFEQLNSTYELYEPFSMEDTEFVQNYANNKVEQTSQTGNIQPFGMGMFESSYTEKFDKTGGFGKIKFSGAITSNINLLSHSYGGRMTVNFNSGHDTSKAELSVTNSAYGIVGGNGIGVVYDGSIDSTKTKDFSKAFTLNEMKDYAAVGVVYTYTNAKVRITTTSGSTYSVRAFE